MEEEYGSWWSIFRHLPICNSCHALAPPTLAIVFLRLARAPRGTNHQSVQPAAAPGSGDLNGSGGASSGGKPEGSSGLFAVTRPRMRMSRVMDCNKAEWEAVAPGYDAWMQEQQQQQPLQLDAPPGLQQSCTSARGQKARRRQWQQQQQTKPAAGQEAGQEAGLVMQEGVKAEGSAGSGGDNHAAFLGLFDDEADPEQSSSRNSNSSGASRKVSGGSATSTRSATLLLDDLDHDFYEPASGAGAGWVTGGGGVAGVTAPSSAASPTASLLLDDLDELHAEIASWAAGTEAAGGTPCAAGSASASTSGYSTAGKAKRNPKGGKGMMFATTTTQVGAWVVQRGWSCIGAELQRTTDMVCPVGPYQDDISVCCSLWRLSGGKTGNFGVSLPCRYVSPMLDESRATGASRLPHCGHVVTAV